MTGSEPLGMLDGGAVSKYPANHGSAKEDMGCHPGPVKEMAGISSPDQI